jgi:hypothetical protein
MKRGNTVRPYLENVTQMSVPTMLRAALKETTYQNPLNPTTAIAKPTGMPKKNKTRRRTMIPTIPIKAKLNFQSPFKGIMISTYPP